MAEESLFHLTLVSDRRPEQVADLALDLASDLRHQRDLDVHEASRLAEPGEKAAAEIGILGQLALTFLSAGAATARTSA